MTYNFNLTKNEVRMIQEALRNEAEKRKATQNYEASYYGQLAEYLETMLENNKQKGV